MIAERQNRNKRLVQRTILMRQNAFTWFVCVDKQVVELRAAGIEMDVSLQSLHHSFHHPLR